MSGSVSEVLACVDTGAATSDTACASLASAGYVVQPVAGVLLSQSEYSSFQLQTAPFDNSQAMDCFGSGLGLPVLAYVLGQAIGLARNLVLKAVR